MKVQLTNLRALQNTGEVDISPITVLLGKNSIGKSTFARSFSLMKQSLFINRSEPVLWYSPDLVDFGSFEESVTRGNDEIEFEYIFELSDRDIKSILRINIFWRNLLILKDNIYDSCDTETRINFTIKKNQISKIRIKFLDFNYEIKYDSKYKVESFIINDNESSLGGLSSRSDFRRGEIIPRLNVTKSRENDRNLISSMFFVQGIEGEIFQLFDRIKDGRTNEKTINRIINELKLGDYTRFSADFVNTIEQWKTISEKYQRLSVEERSQFLSKFYSLIGEYYYNSLVEMLNDYLSDYFSEVQYIAPIRATAERYYRIQGISLNEITSQGENVPMILYNMKSSEKKEWKQWTRENFNGIEFDVSKNSSNLSLISSKAGQSINLADTGFGYSQILPILLYLWQKGRKNRIGNKRFLGHDFGKHSLLIIEQPELHLHPALQSSLIDSFATIVKREELNVSILIETHSDTIVNRLGEHIISENSDIKSTDINLVFFEENKEDDCLAKLRQIKFDEHGRLEGWPVGFFEPGPIKGLLGDIVNDN